MSIDFIPVQNLSPSDRYFQVQKLVIRQDGSTEVFLVFTTGKITSNYTKCF